MITWLSIAPTDIPHARLVLGAWNLANAGLYYPPDLTLNWSQADGIVLHAFSQWWNAPGKLPIVSLGVVKDGIVQAELTDAHLVALDKWAAETSTQITPPVLDVPASKALLVLWSRTSGATAPGALSDYGLKSEDLGLTWTARDAAELKAFSAWHSPPLGSTGVLSPEHSAALKTWAAQAAAKVPAGWASPPAQPAVIPKEEPAPVPPGPIAPAPKPGTTTTTPTADTGTPWWLWVGGAVVLGAGIWTLSKVLNPAGGSPPPSGPAANPLPSKNVDWNKITKDDRVTLEGKPKSQYYVVTHPNGKKSLALWSGHDARDAQRWLDAKASQDALRAKGRMRDNPKGSRRIGTFGDVNPVDYDGAHVEYTHGLDGGDTPEKMVVYSVTVPDDVFAEHTWAEAEDVARSIGTNAAQLIASGMSHSLQERVGVLEDIADYYGWHELDNYPLVMTEKALRRRWRMP